MSEIQKPGFSSPYENPLSISAAEKPLSIPVAENPLSIPAAENPLSIPTAATLSSIPTAIYCRVSTLHPHQQDSLENQIRHYQEFMKKTPNYILTEIYYDFGISGYKETRPGFCKMLEDAQKGCFRQIITKSITRFARNTDTVLKTTRQLKELGIDIYFELQKIHTLSQEGELLLTLFAAFAQAESENARWLTKAAIQQKYRRGHPMRQLHRCLGYQKDQEGNLVPDKNAELVRQIFQMAADGWSISQITKYLNENKITTQNDRTFSRSTVSRILHNHAYKGDYICQRYYVNNQRKLVRNKGEKQMYYIRHDHPAIVSEEMWENAQEKLAKKSERNRQELPSDEIVVTKKAQDPDTLEKINQKKTILQKEESGFIPDKPPLTLANYPYKDRIFCKYCRFQAAADTLPETTLSGGYAMVSAEKEKLFAKVSAYQMKSFPASKHQFFSIYRKGAYRWKRNLRLFPQARRMETLNLPTVPNAEWQHIAGCLPNRKSSWALLPIRLHITRIILMKKRNTSLPESFPMRGFPVLVRVKGLAFAV